MAVKKFMSHEQQYVLLKETRKLNVKNKEHAINELKKKIILI